MISLYLALIDDEQDKNDFEQLYHQYRKQMYVFANQMLQSPEDSEDVVHDVFLEIAQKHLATIQRINNEQDVRNYLLTAVKYKTITLLRKKGRTAGDVGERCDLPQSTYRVPEQVLEELIQKQEADVLREALEQLSEKDRNLLYSYYTLGLKSDKISLILNQKPSTTRKQLTRARAKLAKILEDRM